MNKQLWGLLLLVLSASAIAEEPAIQQRFNERYQKYFQPDGQSLLPFPNIEKAYWTKLQAERTLITVYREPGKYYNSKIYTFTLYQAADSGSYYLDVTGGFWGMDQLIYGPLQAEELQ